MSADAEPRLTLDELRSSLAAADPAAVLVPPRLLRRIIKRDRKLTTLGLQVPHRESYVLGRDALLKLVPREELGLAPDQELPPTVLLLASPEPERLAALPHGEALLKFWRTLFHARVHAALAHRQLTRDLVRQRIHQIGQTEFDEVRSVLRQEKRLHSARDQRAVYEEFAAQYLELRCFAATLLPRYFPAITEPGRIDALLAEDVDAAALFAQTRLAGAPDPVFPRVVAGHEDEDGPEPTGHTTISRVPSAAEYQRLLTQADQAAATGNIVRAAICRMQAAGVAAPELAAEVRSRAQADLSRLVDRLRHALRLDDTDADAWRSVLPALLPRAALGFWPAEAQVLYNLQKVCVDHERPIYSPDLVEWMYSLFREPLVRPLPDQPWVLTVKHLRAAVKRLPGVHVPAEQRPVLAKLLHAALHHAETELRDRFRPRLHDVLDRVGLLPRNFPEQVGRDKLIEELLDRICERGFLNLGDVRDAVARNAVKLADVSGPGEFVFGDALLKANRELAAKAPGVYHRGEIYLRWLQRLTALAFGTRPGRWLTLFLAMPILGAVATVVFVQEMQHLARLPHHLEPATFGVTVGVLSVFYVLLLHVSGFRRAVLRGLRGTWLAARQVFWDLPIAFARLPAVRRVLDSWPFLLFLRYGLKPLPVGVLVGVGLWAVGTGLPVALAIGLATLPVAGLFLNSRLGRDLEEAATDWGVRNWEYFNDFVPGLIRLAMDTFERLLEGMQRLLYTVDEWLRFRGGQSRLTLVLKTVLGFAWFLVSYVIRLYVIVFIEPTVNPVKHFPSVTVAAKMLVPFWVPLTKVFAEPLMFLSEPVALAVAFVIVHAIPGAAGFLVWELKENWRLYEANRPATLPPVVIGSHGETMLHLMKPGFHSGTLPKLHGKLRRAERKSYRIGDFHSPRQLREALHHVEESLHHFVERELLAYLHGSSVWTAGPVRLVGLDAGSNRVRIELACPALGDTPLELRFEEQSGRLLAQVARTGWLSRLTAEDTAVATLVLTGFYKAGGVEIVREQLESLFMLECPPYDIAQEGLVLWTGKGCETEVIYDFDLPDEDLLRPRVVEGKLTTEMPVLDPSRVFFDGQPVTWSAWVEAWQRDQAGEAPAKPLLPGVRILPKPIAQTNRGSIMRSVLGLDIGGANLKAAHSAGVAVSVPFPLWKNPARLPDALRDLVRRLPPADHWAVTMTGELCDCFATKREGVSAILDTVEAVAVGTPVRVWRTDGRLVSPEEARKKPLLTAAANWLALATFAGRFAPAGPALLLDIGSTTTDIIPLMNGNPVPKGRTDTERLHQAELVYTGVRRTPLCALLGGGGAAELFATTLDMYLVLGVMPEDPDCRDTADGRPATRDFAHARLARMICGDLETTTAEERLGLARRCLLRQHYLLDTALQSVAGRLPSPPETVILSGSGEPVARILPLVKSAQRVLSLKEQFGPEISDAACAYALAVLAAEQ